MTKAKEIFKSWRIWLLILFIVGSYIAISPKLATDGVLVTSVETNSSAELNGVVSGEVIYSVNGKEIRSVEDYSSAMTDIEPGDVVKITTDQGSHSFVAMEEHQMTVSDVPKSNIKKGLELVGGVRVILKPEKELTQQQLSDVIMITQKRLNVFGLTDITVRQVNDLDGNSYILVEMAGATPQEATKIISQQGKFEAKIGNETVFMGGRDIKSVCRSAECAGIRACNEVSGGWVCQAQFRVDVSPESAKKHADVTSKLDTILVGSKHYLSEKLDLYLDDELVDSLYISADLQGQESTSFVIESPGGGRTKEDAANDALAGMKKMQTLLITGSLPVKLNVERMDVVSPALGQEFFKSAVMAFIIATIAVGAVIFVRYRKLKISLPIIFTCLSEIFIIFGVAALIRWNIDLAALAGILATVGTGVDAQIIITDELLGEGTQAAYNWKQKLKRAFFIIFGSYATLLAAMIPLGLVGAGLLKGFALVTIIGVSVGVFITRPAYAHIIEVMLK